MRGSFWGRHVPGWRRGSAPGVESAAAKMPCHRYAGNLQCTTCTTSAVDNLLKCIAEASQLSHLLVSLLDCAKRIGNAKALWQTVRRTQYLHRASRTHEPDQH